MMNKNEVGLYFGSKAFADAVLTGENHIFLSAIQQDSDEIRNHVIREAKKLGLELSGNPLELPNGAALIFVLSDSKVIGGYTGNAYAINCFDETNFSYISDLVFSWAMLNKHQAVLFASE